MNTAIINIRTEVDVKEKAQRIAEEMGFSLSSIVNSYLKKFIKTKTLFVSLDEKPNAYLKQMLKESEADIKAGRVVSFEKPNDALDYLDSLIKKDEKN